MRITFDGEIFRVTHITGPTHNYLAMVVVDDGSDDDWQLVERKRANEPRRLTEREVRVWIGEGVRRANETLGAHYRVVRAEFFADDSHYAAIYRAMAEKIVLTAHTSPEPDQPLKIMRPPPWWDINRPPTLRGMTTPGLTIRYHVHYLANLDDPGSQVWMEAMDPDYQHWESVAFRVRSKPPPPALKEGATAYRIVDLYAGGGIVHAERLDV
jgi:hypothetical protein